jgi:hypothetical protein
MPYNRSAYTRTKSWSNVAMRACVGMNFGLGRLTVYFLRPGAVA